jgi:murein DD-endopeptidase MepM/ murein hydrolase activator NlpD
MPAPRRFNFLVVHDDGRRIARVILPRWLILSVLGLSVVVPVSVAVIYYTDYLHLRSQRATLNDLAARVAAQQGVIDASQSKMREIRAEIDGWRELHARIWEPFRPEDGSARRGTGIGGGTGPARVAETPDRAAIGDELDRLTDIVKGEGDNLRALERFLGRATRVLAALPSRWPVRGQVNSDYGSRVSPWSAKPEFHSGLDIGAPVGTPVRAPAPGIVVFAGVHAEYGQTLIVDHGNDTKSIYGHLSRLHVAVNQKVERGEAIALTGNTGRSSGPHLHYEIQVKGQSVDPTSYLWE